MLSRAIIRAAAFGVAALPLFAADVGAAGFAIKEQSTTALGNAFSGATAGGDDLSYMYFNPASIMRQSGSQIVGAAAYIRPQARFGDEKGTTLLGTSISGGNGGSDIGKDALVPSLYALWDYSRDLKFAIGVNAPWGLVTDYGDDWVGRYHALKSDLKTININPVIGFRLSESISVPRRPCMGRWGRPFCV